MRMLNERPKMDACNKENLTCITHGKNRKPRYTLQRAICRGRKDIVVARNYILPAQEFTYLIYFCNIDEIHIKVNKRLIYHISELSTWTDRTIGIIVMLSI